MDLLPNAPACLAPGVAPGDGGFGSSPVRVVDGKSVCGGTKSFPITLRGNEAFNTPPLVEAADTPPYFHNNAAATLEDAVAFYTTDTFDASPSGAGRAFILTEDEIRQIAAFLRALNAVQNVDEAIAHIDNAKSLPAARAKLEIEMASAQVQDAIEVLTTGPLKLFTPDPGRGLAQGSTAEARCRHEAGPAGRGQGGPDPGARPDGAVRASEASERHVRAHAGASCPGCNGSRHR